MPLYIIKKREKTYSQVIIEADNEEEAYDRAMEDPTIDFGKEEVVDCDYETIPIKDTDDWVYKKDGQYGPW